MSFKEAIPVKRTFIHFPEDDDEEEYQPVIHSRTTSGRVQPPLQTPKQSKEEKMRRILAESEQIEEVEFEQDTSPHVHQDLVQEEESEEESADEGEEADDNEDEEEHGSLSVTIVVSAVSGPSMTSMGSEAYSFGCDDGESGFGESGLPVATEEEKRAAHQQKECRPCAYFLFKPDGCRKGMGCEFCHFCTREDAKRWKVMRQRDVRLAKKRQAAAQRSNPDTFYTQTSPMDTAPSRSSPMRLPGGCYQSSETNGFIVAPTFMSVARQHQPIPV